MKPVITKILSRLSPPKASKYQDHLGQKTTTLTVAGLRAALRKYPADMPVFAEWEGQYVPVRKDALDREQAYGKESLIIDVNDY